MVLKEIDFILYHIQTINFLLSYLVIFPVFYIGSTYQL